MKCEVDDTNFHNRQLTNGNFILYHYTPYIHTNN